MNNPTLWSLTFIVVFAVEELGRRALPMKFGHRPQGHAPTVVDEPPPPKEEPIGTVPVWVRQVVIRLRRAAEQIESATDQENLLQGCNNLIALYERQVLNGMRSVNIPKLEERLNKLAEVVERYIDIQNNPHLYLYDKSSEQLVAADSLAELMADGSKAISGFANAVLVAIRDDNLAALHAYRVYSTVLGTDSD
jgi:hypothetical protein